MPVPSRRRGASLPLRRAEEAGKSRDPDPGRGRNPDRRPAQIADGRHRIALRIPSTAALFDAWSVEPLASRPLSDEARERIVDAWSEVAKEATGTPRLELVLPGAEREATDEAAIIGAVRADMRTMRVDARHHWVRRALAPARDPDRRPDLLPRPRRRRGDRLRLSEGSLSTLLSQTFVVMAWVALWGPAYRLLTAASFRPRPPLLRRTRRGRDHDPLGLSGGSSSTAAAPRCRDEPARRDEEPLQDLVVLVQEPDVEGEPHAEGVDGGAARDQRAPARPRPGRARQAEQTGPETDRDRHLMPADDAGAAANRGGRRASPIPRPRRPRSLPPPTPTRFWLDFVRENSFSLQPGVQGGARQGTRIG